MSANAGVMKVLEGMAVEAYRYRLDRGTESEEASAEDSKAIAAVAELVAADREYDRLWAELNGYATSPLSFPAIFRAVQAIDERRKAALAAMGGDS